MYVCIAHAERPDRVGLSIRIPKCITYEIVKATCRVQSVNYRKNFKYWDMYV